MMHHMASSLFAPTPTPEDHEMAHEALHAAPAKADWSDLYDDVARDKLTDHRGIVEA